MTCPDCGYQRNVFANNDVGRCRTCADKIKRNGSMVACPNCGTERYLAAQAIQDGHRFCGLSCASEYQHKVKTPETDKAWRAKISASKKGARNPNYKDGVRAGDPPRAWGVKSKGEVRCRNCGSHRHLHLHHVIPRSMFKAGVAELRNGVPLCASCHHGWHRRCVTIHREIFTAEEWRYLTSVDLLGQEVRAWLDDRYPSRCVPAVSGKSSDASSCPRATFGACP